jgi:HSP20 family protein
MAGLMRRESYGEAAAIFGRLDRLFEEWVRMVPFPRGREAGDFVRVDEFRENGTLVVRAELPGVDPDKDVEVTISGGMLHIEAERHVQEGREEEDYLRQEIHYGTLSRSLPLPTGTTEADVTAAYAHGVLEVRVPVAAGGGETAQKIEIKHS